MNTIKKRRQKAGITQQQLAKEAGVSQSLIAKIESGLIDPAYSKVEKIKEALTRTERKEELKAKQVMNKKVWLAKPSDNIIEAVKLMSSKEISQMPVIDKNNIIGLMTEKSVLERIEENISQTKVKEVMEDAPPIIEEETPVSVLNELLKHYPIIVVRKKGELKGVVTKSDIIRKMI